jgi:hypothetical protein
LFDELKSIVSVNAIEFTLNIGAEAIGEAGLRSVVGAELADVFNPHP